MNLEGRRDRSSAYVKDENGVLLSDVELIRERWVREFHTLLNTKSPRVDLNIAEGLDQWPENMSLRVQLMIQELTDAIRSLASGKAVAPDGVSATVIPPCTGDCSISSFVFEGGARCRSNGKMPSFSTWYSMKRKIGQSAATTGASR